MDLLELQSRLSMARENPDEFAYLYNRGPGSTGIVVGEVIYILQCIAIQVVPRRTEECYMELPINVSGTPKFLSPKTHIIQDAGTPIDCNSVMPVLYFLDGAWYSVYPRLHRVETPEKLKADNTYKWKYITSVNLWTSGIYSERELASLQDRIMFPSEAKAVSETLARSLLYKQPLPDHLAITNLLSDDHMDNLVNRYVTKTWAWISRIGTVTSFVIGVYSIWKILNSIITMIFNGTILYDIYGASFKVCFACCNGVTSAMTHRYYKNASSARGDDLERGEEVQTLQADTSTSPSPDGNAPRQTPATTMYPVAVSYTHLFSSCLVSYPWSSLKLVRN